MLRQAGFLHFSSNISIIDCSSKLWLIKELSGVGGETSWVDKLKFAVYKTWNGLVQGEDTMIIIDNNFHSYYVC